jgi:hypothetical protein
VRTDSDCTSLPASFVSNLQAFAHKYTVMFEED